MHYDLWDIAVAKYLGRFDTEAEALQMVRALLATNGDAYTEDLVLSSTEDRRGAHNLTGEALLQQARALDSDDETEEDRHSGLYASRLASTVKLAADSPGRAVKRLGDKPHAPSKGTAWAQRSLPKSGQNANRSSAGQHKIPKTRKD